MACSPVNIPGSHIVTARRGTLGVNCSLRRSSSGEELYKLATLRRSYSDNQLCSSSLLRASSTRSSKLNSQVSSSTLQSPVKALMFDTDARDGRPIDDRLEDAETEVVEEKDQKPKKANWVGRLLELRTRWKGRQGKEVACRDDDCEDGCPVDYSDGEAAEATRFDSESFSRLLLHVPWSDAKRFSKLAFLCDMAYRISEIKVHDLQQEYSLNYVTSSLEKKAEAIAVKAILDEDTTQIQENYLTTIESGSTGGILNQDHALRPSIAYEIAASAASHVKYCSKNESYSFVLGDAMTNKEMSSVTRSYKSEKAAQMAASTMTSVVAAKEREKQKIAKELQSLHSSPCEWFISDDPVTGVRYFIIQGSESLASWQANLFFEPAKFEGTDALVHRGIYEAAKGLYEQFLPQIQNHMSTYREDAKLQFTGHSLGGSLSLLVHLMLIARKAVKSSALQPVVTFGSPFVFCGGDKVLEQLGLKESMVQSIVLHRDIVPRAFSCNYPRQVAQVLKRLNSSFRSHPCLNKQKMLYSSLGHIFILQPSQKLSPSHPFLPPGNGLYAFDSSHSTHAANALRAFLNTPHPLETLSDPTAYGSEGTIIRDHDSKNYLKAVRGILKQYTKTAFRKVRNERHLIRPWPSVSSPSQQAWIHEHNLENRAARKEVMSRV